jgi:hypothetical protein
MFAEGMFTVCFFIGAVAFVLRLLDFEKTNGIAELVTVLAISLGLYPILYQRLINKGIENATVGAVLIIASIAFMAMGSIYIAQKRKWGKLLLAAGIAIAIITMLAIPGPAGALGLSSNQPKTNKTDTIVLIGVVSVVAGFVAMGLAAIVHFYAQSKKERNEARLWLYAGILLLLAGVLILIFVPNQKAGAAPEGSQQSQPNPICEALMAAAKMASQNNNGWRVAKKSLSEVQVDMLITAGWTGKFGSPYLQAPSNWDPQDPCGGGLGAETLTFVKGPEQKGILYGTLAVLLLLGIITTGLSKKRLLPA